MLDTFNAAGGGLLAGGLAYAALFALLPALLLVTAALGLFVSDPARQQAAIDAIGAAFPPLAPIAAQTLEQVSAGAVPVTIIGLAGLAWGASRFYGSLDGAFARVFSGTKPRSMVMQIVRGLLSVLFITVVFVGGAALTGITSALVERAPFGVVVSDATRELWRFAAPVVAAIVFVVGVAIVYRLVPDRHVSIRALWLPALGVGIALELFTQLFTYIAPRLIGAAALYGSLAAIFALMVWLATSFQVLLLGAAWVRIRLAPPPPTVTP